MHLQVHHIHDLKASCMRQLINLKLFVSISGILTIRVHPCTEGSSLDIE